MEALKGKSVCGGIAQGTIRILARDEYLNEIQEEPVILFVEDLEDSRGLSLDGWFVRGLVAKRETALSCGDSSTGNLCLPTLVGVNYAEDMQGQEAVVDGFCGILYVNPEAQIKRELAERGETEKRVGFR